MRTPRFPAIPVASEMVFIGPVGSSLAHRRRSGRRLNLNHNSLTACVHGVVNVCSAVVRTTETMVIHWECGTYHQRRYLSTKREIEVTSMRVLVFSQLQRPGAKRTLVLGLQSQTVACGGGNGAAGLDMPRVRTSVFHRNRRRTWK